MIPKYTVEYIANLRRPSPPICYCTDDPVVCEEMVEELLERGFLICSIKHEGLALGEEAFIRMIKTAAKMMTAKRICTSLRIKAEEERFRFGFAA